MDAGITWWSLYGRWYSFLVSGCMLMLLLVHQEIFFFSLMLAMRPRDLNFPPDGPCWYTRNFFFLV